MDHDVISADGHVDFPLLPEHLWRDNAPAQLKDRMPRVVETDKGRMWQSAAGVPLGLVGGMGSGGRRYVPGQIHRADRMAEQGLYRDQANGIMRPTVPELRVKDQELDGLKGEVIYGILGAANRLDDPEVTAAVVHIYNEWLADFCQAELGLSHDMLPLWHHDWEPMWQASAETKVPVHLHTVGPPIDNRWYSDTRTRRPWFATHMTAFQVPTLSVLAAVIFGGGLERYPDLKVVIGESGIGWIPYALERMDNEWEDQFQDVVPRRPSEYWYGQMYATFQSVLEEMFAGVDPEIVRKVTHDNAARLYGFA